MSAFKKFDKILKDLRKKDSWSKIAGYINMSERNLRRIKNQERLAPDKELLLYINTLEKYLK